MPGKARVTIADVAARCRVAKSTVSKVLNRQPDRYHIAEGTRELVLAAAERLGFTPDQRRRVAATKVFGTIALLFNRYAPFTDGVFQGLPRALAQAAEERGYRITFHPIADGMDTWRRGMHHHTCDGAILTAPLPDGIELLPKLGLPVVVFNEDTALPLVHVQCDDRASAHLATRHLISLGHRRIAFLSGKGGSGAHYSCTERWIGYGEAMHASGLPLIDCRYKVAEELVQSWIARPDATAVVTYSHLEGMGVLEAAFRLGLRIPQQLSVVSLDDFYLLERACPPLTAMNLPLAAMAAAAVESVIALIGSAAGGKASHRLPCSLVERRSTAAPPAE